MGDEVLIREALLGDVEAIIDAVEPVAADGRFIATEAPVDRERMRAAFAATIAAPDATIFVAVCDARIVGSLGLHRAFGGPADLGMSLLAEYRGRGIGGQMMERAIVWARAHNYHKLELSVYPWNAAALALYEKFGFEREGYLKKHVRRRNGELWDVVVMGLLLAGGAEREFSARTT
jgi:RimJ/RimL family protein N-acetyltransferase